MSDKDQTTHFGFETIAEDEKAGRVHGVFSSVASRYDLMNDLMSAGIHRVWKAAMIDWLAPRRGMTLLDVAGGTGDIAFRFLSRARDGHATVCDMTQAMLDEGQRRAEEQGIWDVDWICGDAMALPFEDKSFDAYTIAFGIRNVTRIEDALAEAYRVLKPGGRFLCLEFSHMTVPAAQWAYDRYSFNVIPPMGRAVTGDSESYKYLVESIRRFPDQETFAQMIRRAGFA
ncbi:MAG: class I SAM-dependent methyltransferase, partial [Pseudomonadota bacterium]